MIIYSLNPLVYLVVLAHVRCVLRTPCCLPLGYSPIELLPICVSAVYTLLSYSVRTANASLPVVAIFSPSSSKAILSVASIRVGDAFWELTNAQWMIAAGRLDGGWQRSVTDVPAAAE